MWRPILVVLVVLALAGCAAPPPPPPEGVSESPSVWPPLHPDKAREFRFPDVEVRWYRFVGVCAVNDPKNLEEWTRLRNTFAPYVTLQKADWFADLSVPAGKDAAEWEPRRRALREMLIYCNLRELWERERWSRYHTDVAASAMGW